MSEGCPAPMSLYKQKCGLVGEQGREERQQEMPRSWDSQDSLQQIQSLTEAADSRHASFGRSGRHGNYFTAELKIRRMNSTHSCTWHSRGLCMGMYVCLQLCVCSGWGRESVWHCACSAKYVSKTNTFRLVYSFESDYCNYPKIRPSKHSALLHFRRIIPLCFGR